MDSSQPKRIRPEGGPETLQDAPGSNIADQTGKGAGGGGPSHPRAISARNHAIPETERRRELPTFDDLGPNVPTFQQYFERQIGYIREVQNCIQLPLDDNLAAMDVQVRDAEAHGNRMSSILAWCDSYLDVAEHIALRKMPPRDPKDWTDLDREKALAAAVARERRFRDVVRGLCESIEKRVSYAQSRMRAFAQADRQALQ